MNVVDTVRSLNNPYPFPRINARSSPSLGDHGVVLLGGAVGISVARSPIDGHLRCLGAGSLVVERLNKEQSKRGIKFFGLLRSANIPVRHCKNITCEC